jgi:acyl-CoA synthetase (AMP-forming)/AMP-acid ligase II
MAEAWPTAHVDPGSLVVDGATRPATGADAVPVVGCGRPLAGVAVDVVGHDGAPLPEGRVGEIRVRGDCLAAGYAPTPGTGPSSTQFADGALLTGDAGFLRDGQLYVLGRLGDALKVRARTVFAEDLETALVAAGLPGHRVAAALGVHRGVPTAVVFLEMPRAGWHAVGERVLRRRAEGAAVAVLEVAAGTIPRTSSGKPRRRALWRLFLADARSEPPPVAQQGDSDLQEV